MTDRTIAPTVAQRHAAHVRGLRPRGRWLEAAGGAFALTTFFGVFGPWFVEMWCSAFADFVAGDFERLVDLGATVVSTAAATVFAGAVLVAFATRQVGAVRPDVSVRPVPRRAMQGVAAVVAVPLALLGLLLLTPVLLDAVAGGARAADARLMGLVGLWASWPARLTFAVGLVLSVIGTIELFAARRRLWRGLHRTPAEAREDARRNRSPRMRNGRALR